MENGSRPVALVTGASSGIGLELAKCCAANGFDLVIAADEPGIRDVSQELQSFGAQVHSVEADLATLAGVDKLYAEAMHFGRPVEALLANAGRGLGHSFLDQDFSGARRVIDTNITGTAYLIHKIGRDMRDLGRGPHPDHRIDRRLSARRVSSRL